MAKQIIFSEEARRSLKTGIDIVVKSVATTLGPKGRNVALDRKFGSPKMCIRDSVQVAQAMIQTLPDDDTAIFNAEEIIRICQEALENGATETLDDEAQEDEVEPTSIPTSEPES